jgi:hypothetical protein
MITDIYSYVIEVVVRMPTRNYGHRFLFLDIDPSKAMNIEARAKDHIKALQLHIKANIVSDVGGNVRVPVYQCISYLSHTTS